MKSSLRPSLNLVLAACAAAASTALDAASLPETNWHFHQDFQVAAPGLLRVAVPLDTLDRAAPDLRDLRVVGADRQEVPFALIRTTTSAAHWEKPADFTVSLTDASTQITVRTGADEPWDSVELTTSTPRFMKAAKIEASTDGARWETWEKGVPVFRQDGAELTRLPLRRAPAPWLRITLDDAAGGRVVINGLRLRTLDRREATFATLPLEIEQNDQSANESVLNLRLPAAHLDVERLEIDAADTLFTRRVNVGVREVRGDEIVERIVGTDTIFRVAPEGAKPAEANRVALNGPALPGRELLLHIDNGDSQPLRIRGVRAVQSRVYLVFEAAAAGPYSLWTGNPQAAAPRYDLAGLTSQLRHLPESEPGFAPAEANPDYHQPDPLAGLALEGSAIDPAQWRVQRRVLVQTPGVQTLELDPAALASLDPQLRDLRLARDGKQVPFLIERTATTRSLDVTLAVANRADHPRESQWTIALPFARLPIDRISLQTSTAVFDRYLEVSEQRESRNGTTFDMTLGSMHWQRGLNESTGTVFLQIERPSTSRLTIRTQNGDNPPIALEQAKVFYPITRVLFRADAAGDSIALLSGNDAAASPHYDIALVAEALLRSEKQVATLSPQSSEQKPVAVGATAKSVLLWTTLSLVVAGLLFVVAKLLPSGAEK